MSLPYLARFILKPVGPNNPYREFLEMFFRFCLPVLCAIVTLFASSSAYASVSSVLQKFTLFPEVHTNADLRRFINQKTAYQKKHHYIEATLEVEPLWFSYDSLIYLATAFDVNLGMGHTPKDVVFDPMDAFFGFTPFIETRFEHLSARFGLDHRCFHEIDQKELPTVYWNKLFISAHAPHMRLTDFADYALSGDSHNWLKQTAWSIRAGIFLKNFFGIVRRSSVDYENDRRMEFDAKIRALAFRYENWAFCSELGSMAGGYKGAAQAKSHLYWSQMLSAQALYRSPEGKIMYLFVRGTLDDMPRHRNAPRFSRSSLIELGIGVGL